MRRLRKIIKLIGINVLVCMMLITQAPFALINAATEIDDIKQNIEKRSEELKNLEKNKARIQDNLDEEFKKLSSYQEQIETLDAQIEAINQRIQTSQNRIDALEISIADRAKEIKKLDDRVKGYLLNSQTAARTNGYLEFAMSGKDFASMIRRFEGMMSINRYNEDIAREAMEARQKLNDEKKLQEEEKAQIELSKKEIEIEKQTALVYEERVSLIVKELHHKVEKLEEELESINYKNSADQAKVKQIEDEIAAEIKRQEEEQKRLEEEKKKEEEEGNTPTEPSNPTPPTKPTGGFGAPLPSGSYDVTASVWHYPEEFGGSAHMGVDLGVNRGTPVYAMGIGIVTAINTSCFEGDWSCGGGYGNYVSYLVNVDGHNYGIVNAHLNSVNVSIGSVVSMGAVVGYTGNTGSSTGPHLHLETIDMGGGTLTEAWNRWDGTMNFGTGPASWGGRRCDQGYGVPCRLHPQATTGIW